MDVAVTNGGVVSVLPGLAGGGYGAGTDYTAGNNPVFVTTADVTGDGRLDLVVANAGDPNNFPQVAGSVSILPGLVGGGFGARTDYGSGIFANSIAIGDLDGDGHLDLAVTDGSLTTMSHVSVGSVMFGLPGGGFGAATTLPVVAPPSGTLGSIAMGDLNGDGLQDLAVAATSSAIVLLQIAGGGFTSSQYDIANNFGYAVAIRDVDGDGRQDLVMGLDSGIGVLRGLPGGSLDAEVDYATGGGVSGLAFSDLNGDGRLDVAVANYIGSPVGSVTVLQGLAGGGLGLRTDYATAGGSASVAIGDMDGDGGLDLVTANPDVDNLTQIRSQSGGGFAVTPYYATGAAHFSLAVGDLNGDGRQDVAVPNTVVAQASILLGQPNGRLDPGGNYGPSRNARGVAIGDLNADGVPDLVVANVASVLANPGTVSATPGLPGGALGAGTDYTVGANPRSPVLADFNGDGLLDLAVANNSSGSISVLMGVPGGGFGARTDHTTGTAPISIAVGDLDHDGRPDLAVVNTTSRTVSILIGVAGGGFAPAVSYPTLVLPRNVAIADLNGDGNLDLAVACGVSASAVGRASVYLGAGNGTFAPRSDYPTGVGTTSIAAGDLDGDGRLDLAVGNIGSTTAPGTVSVLLGLAGGGFGLATNYGATGPQGIAIDDLSGDGRPDLAIANFNPGGAFIAQSTIGVMPNLGAALAVNHAPLLTAAPMVSSPAGDPVSAMATATDPDAQQSVTLSSTVSPPAPWLLQHGGAAAPLPAVTISRAGTSAPGDAGTYTITWTATDNSPAHATTTMVTTLVLTPATDRAPIVSAPPTAEGAKNALLTFGVTVSDPDHDAITSLTATGTAITSGAAFATSPDNLAGTLSWTPGLGQVGDYSVTFTAVNTLTGSATTDITITDTEPVVTAPLSVTVAGGSLLTVNVTASDPDGDPIASLTATGTAITAGAVFAAGPANATGILTWTPSLAQGGSYGATFTASNALSNSATTSILVTNRPPSVTAPATVQAFEDDPLTFQVYASDPEGDAITSLTASGPGPYTFAASGDNTSGTYSAPSFSFAPGTYAVTFTASNTVSGSATTVITISHRLTPPFITAWGSLGSGPNELHFPFGVAVDAAGNVYVADTVNNRIVKFTNTGTYITQWGGFGAGNGQLNNPVDVAVDSNGKVYVTDSSNQRIQVFSSTGSYISQWPCHNPQSVAVDGSGKVYVADVLDDEIDVFTSAGQPFMKFGTTGTGNGQFSYPRHVRIDNGGNIYVSDYFNSRIQKFTNGGAYITQWPSNLPTGIAIDGAGNVYVGDNSNSRVSVYTSVGQFLTRWGVAGTGPGQFTYPQGIAIDSHGDIYVVDSNGSRIEKFGPVPGLVARAPVVTAPATYSGAEGSALSINVTASDPDGDPMTSLTAAGTAVTAGAIFTPGAGNTTGTLAWTPTYTQAGSYGVAFTASNALSGSATTAITIANVNRPPVVTISAPSSGALYAMGAPVSFVGSFTDDAGETHTATWSFDATTTAGTVNETAHSVTASYTFTAAGVYNVSLKVTDNGGLFGTASAVGDLTAMVVVYDPSAGFVTGGGWINSPAGAYPANPTLVGKANFGFVSKYKKGATVPTGETEFVFSVAGMSFHASVYEWLVISGAKAQYKGSGTINGAGDYRFMLTATDGHVSGGGGVDKLRMKIWENATGTIAYDNQPLAADGANPVTALGGGSISIQTNGGSAAGDMTIASDEASTATRYALLQNSPNPFNPETVISYETAGRSAVHIRVFDISGRLVATLVDGELEAGRHTATWNGRTSTGAPASSGTYFVLMDAGTHRDKRAIVLLK